MGTWDRPCRWSSFSLSTSLAGRSGFFFPDGSVEEKDGGRDSGPEFRTAEGCCFVAHLTRIAGALLDD